MQKAETETKKKKERKWAEKKQFWWKLIHQSGGPGTHTHHGFGGSALQINQKSIPNNLFYWNNKNKTK